MDAGASDSGYCPLIPGPFFGQTDMCRPLSDSVCNPNWSCQGGPYLRHYNCNLSFKPPVPTCRALDASINQSDYCCAEQRCVRYPSMDMLCPKTAGHDYNWACDYLDGSVPNAPPKYEGGIYSAVCTQNPSQPYAPKGVMLCCDDPGP